MKNELGIYVNLPKNFDTNLFRKLILQELDILLLKTNGLKPSSLFFSGDISNINKILKSFPIEMKQFSEVTVELTDISPELENSLQLGVNRISIKVDSFDDEIRSFFNKKSSSAEVIDFIIKYKSDFEISIDLAHLSFLNLRHLEKSLDIFLSLDLNHISIYSCAYHMKTADRFIKLKEENFIAENKTLQDVIGSKLVEFDRYQASNFAKAGFESKQGKIYGQYGNWIGIGPGGCSRIWQGKKRIAIDNYKNTAFWMKNSLESNLGCKKIVFLSQKSIKEEEIIMKLLSNQFIESIYFLKNRSEKFSALFKEGFLEGTPDKFRLTINGFYNYDQVALSILSLI